MPVDRLELAWAAGFFDGEGSTIARTFAKRHGYRQLTLNVPQSGRNDVPAVLVRFQAAMLGMGTISGPNDDSMYCWRLFGRAQVSVALDLLWPFLGEVKRMQAKTAKTLVDAQYASGAYLQRAARGQAPVVVIEPEQPSFERIEHAWCAGSLDAEGCFGLDHVGRRAGGPDWYRVRASADQHGDVNSPPLVLVRLQSALGGRIERHGEPDDYKWLVEGPHRIERVIALAGPYLSEHKRRAAENALRAFRSQIRLKGDETRCLRGHLYTRTAMKGGRLRKICDQCISLYRANQDAGKRVVFQRFEEPVQRYTV